MLGAETEGRLAAFRRGGDAQLLAVLRHGPTGNADSLSSQVADDGRVSLFDGKSMDGWKKISPHENRWVVENGIMINKTRGCDIAAGPNLKNMPRVLREVIL